MHFDLYQGDTFIARGSLTDLATYLDYSMEWLYRSIIIGEYQLAGVTSIIIDPLS